MKLSLLALLFLTSCATPAPPSSVVPESLDLESKTAAIFAKDLEAPRCTGVWVGNYRILTAAHCDRELVGPLYYSVIGEYSGVFRMPRLHSMELAGVDRLHDLAVYRTDAFDTPTHVVAPLARTTPRIGEDLYLMGHTMGLSWSFRHGWVAAYREAQMELVEKHTGPWMQVSAPIGAGDSGGGAFNERGELVGTVSSTAGSAPNTVFYVYLPTIQEFLKGSQ